MQSESMVTGREQVTDTSSQAPAKSALHNWLIRLGVMFVLALLVELFVCNSFYWRFDSEKYQTRELELPYNTLLQRKAFVVTDADPQVNISNLNMDVRSLEIEAYAGDYSVTGSILLNTEASAFTLHKVCEFYVASGINQDLQSPAQDYQRTTIKFDITEKVFAIVIAANKDKVKKPWVITKLTINPQPSLDISIVRILLIMAGLFFLYVTLFSKLYRHQLSLQSKAYKWLNHGIFGAMIVFSCCIFTAYHPQLTTSPVFKLIAIGALPLNTPDHKLLLEIPKTRQGFEEVDPYIQLTDALLVKHQTNLDLRLDPNLLTLNNVYDRSEREAKKVQYHWDRAFYNGKYFCYYGLGPLVVIYAPIYFLTGLVPSPVLACFIATLWALLGLHLVSTRLHAIFSEQCNTTLFIVSKIALFFASYVFILQAQFFFYVLPYLVNMAFVCLGLYFGLGLWFKPKSAMTNKSKDNDETKLEADSDSATARAKVSASTTSATTVTATQTTTQRATTTSLTFKELCLQSVQRLKQLWALKTNDYVPFAWDIKQMLAMIACGICVVLVVMSRPLTLLYLVVCIGILYLLYIFKAQQSPLNKLLNSICLFVPVMIGAVIVSVYNYVRFESIFEFGQFKQLTYDNVNLNQINMSFEFWKTIFYKAFFQNLEISSTFPFVAFNTHTETALGAERYISEGAGLFAIPFFWGLFLLPVIWGIKRFSSQAQNRILSPLNSALGLMGLKLAMALWCVLFVVLLVFCFYNAGWGSRYISDETMVAVLISFVGFMSLKFTWQSTPERLFYVLAVYMVLLSSIYMFFLTINNHSVPWDIFNPRLYVELKDIFDPLSFS